MIDTLIAVTTIGALFRGNSSVGRAIPCQGIGRRFEPGFPLQNLEPRLVRGFIFWMYEFGMIVTLAEWQSGYAAVCKTVDLGSIPGSASKIFVLKLVFFSSISITL